MTSRAKIHPFLQRLLEQALKQGASDLHLKAGIMPVVRKLGALRPLAPNIPEITSAEIDEIVETLLDEDQAATYKSDKEVDLGYGISGLGRFRFNIFRQRGTTRMVIRNIPYNVPKIEDLNLPSIVEKIANIERGLVLVTGVTGSGKSSTLAAMVDHINRTKNKHILTIEDPIEFLIRDRKSIITQRELGVDTNNYTKALRAALRQDPDVILIGEMRDKETIQTALTAAETGHLVLSTLHTLDARETINRILSTFDGHQQNPIRAQLAGVLKAVISQRLARRVDKQGFVPAVEVMLASQRIKEMIEDPAKTAGITDAIAESQSSYGMQTFDQSLIMLLRKKLISVEHAMELTNNPEDFKVKISGVNMDNQSHHNPSGAKSWSGEQEFDLELQPVGGKTKKR